MGMLYFYHYCAVQNNEFGIPTYHNGTIAMGRKVICDDTYSEFIGMVLSAIMGNNTGLIAIEGVAPIVIVTITLLHHGEYE